MVSASVLNGQIYRVAFLPLLLALAVAGFSLSDRPAPLGSPLTPDAFDGARAYAELQALAARFPERAPGGRGDDGLAAYVAGTLRGLGGGGFAVAVHELQGQTPAGRRTLTTVLARRPGRSAAPALAIVAHRDATAGRAGSDAGELAATAVLLELARVFAASETRRSIVLVSTSGGSGGEAGARDFAAHAARWVGGPLDAAIVLGDLGGAPRGPFVAPFSAAPGAAPDVLARTVAQALGQQTGAPSTAPALLDRLAQLSFALPAGEQGPLNAAGLPAVLVQSGGEQPAGGAAPARARLEGLGRAVLGAIYALDAGAEVPAPGGALAIEGKLLPAWAMRLLVAALLLPPLLTAGDGLARARRRRGPATRPIARWLPWVASCALPFLLCALLALALGRLAVLPAPRPPLAPAAAALHGAALAVVLLLVLVFVLGWLAWPAGVRRLELPRRPRGAEPALALLLTLVGLAVVVWAVDPYTALLLVPALHLWLVLAVEPPPGRSRVLAPALVVLGALPLALLVAFYAQRLGLGPGGVAHTAVLLLAGGRIGLLGAVLWSLALGAFVAALLLATAPAPPRALEPEPSFEERLSPIRGPMSYAGPGSLGGTESALRR
jgi:hypothetical protein